MIQNDEVWALRKNRRTKSRPKQLKAVPPVHLACGSFPQTLAHGLRWSAQTAWCSDGVKEEGKQKSQKNNRGKRCFPANDIPRLRTQHRRNHAPGARRTIRKETQRQELRGGRKSGWVVREKTASFACGKTATNMLYSNASESIGLKLQQTRREDYKSVSFKKPHSSKGSRCK